MATEGSLQRVRMRDGPWTAHRAKKQKAHRTTVGDFLTCNWIPEEYLEDDEAENESLTRAYKWRENYEHIMSVLTFGINHHSAPVAIRERLAFTKDSAAIALQTLMEQPGIDEAVILSTCNRTEIYTVAKEPEHIKQWLMAHHQLTDNDISPFCYYHQGLTTVRHLMRVASGLDSMVIGEPEIFGQVKDAFQQGCEIGSVGTHLRQLFPAVFATSKHVRSSTHIGRCPVSLAYAIVKLCHTLFSTIRECNVLLIGAGTIIELIATHLANSNVNNMIIANRTLDRAHQLAQSFNATAIDLHDMPHYLADSDIIISATASPVPLLEKHQLDAIMQAREGRPLFIADLAVPRDIDPAIATLPYTHLYNIDDLREVINHNVSNRHSAAIQAEAMIDLYAANYMRQLRINEAGDIIQHYRHTLIEKRDAELDKAMAELNAGKNPEAVLKNFARNFSNKVMHQPTIQLRQAAADGQQNLLALAKELFK